MSDSQATRAPRSTQLWPARRWLLAVVGLAIFHLSLLLAGKEEDLWLPGLGIGLALVAWLGLRIVPLLALDLCLARGFIRPEHSQLRILGDALLLAGEMGLGWWVYSQLARGARRLDDPRSATVFLILLPGALAVCFASIQALFWGLALPTREEFWLLASRLWISRALGLLALAPPLLVVVTPYLVGLRLTWPEPPTKLPGGSDPTDWTWGEIIETTGLCLGAGILAIVLRILKMEQGSPGWTLWGLSLLVVVWAGLRQGLRGGSLAAVTSALFALGPASILQVNPAEFSPLQGHLLAQCSTALLVGASAGWIRASEARYRQVVGHIPVVLYSARLPRGLTIPLNTHRSGTGNRHDGKPDLPNGRAIVNQAEVTLVSSACTSIFGCEPEDMLGPYSAWLERIDPADREIVIAALAQLCLQKDPVVCEYRLHEPIPQGQESIGPFHRWVRDTLVPHHSTEDSLDGWEGVIEDITEPRALSYNLRRTNNMLQALVTYLPTGIFFVQGPAGLPILVNQRARQLLGQREDLAAGINHLSQVYRLHRPDGSEYPVEELPVTKALRQGTTGMANDVVVHRADGRRVPLITWAAPVDLAGQGHPDAAVWVLEDLTALQQAETARRESEARLRAVIETMAEGVVVQNFAGVIIECNPAACAILGVPQEQLLGRDSFGPETGCRRENGAPFPREAQPDRLALRSGAPVRNVLMGIPVGPEPGKIRWIFLNAMPLPVGNAMAPNTKGARVVTTFADITAHRKALDELQRAQRLELVGRLASGTVHDFNNLLTVMIGLAGLIQTTLPRDNPAQTDLDRLMEAGEQAAHLAGQLLAFSKQSKPVPHGVDLNTVVVHSLKLLKATFPHNIQTEHKLAGDALLVKADENQLKQVVMNLCINARDAMTEGGKLTVATDRVDGPPANGVPDARPSRWVRLSVQDTGQGMDQAVKERIFEPFFSTKERGTGLGLAVVRQIVESFGGRIHVWSKPKEGTRMEILLQGLNEK